MIYLLIDFGSTYIKYAVYNTSSDSFLDEGVVSFPDKIKNNNKYFFEVEPSEIVDALNSIICGISCYELDGIIISVQMHGYLLADKSKKLLTPYISWRDRRASLQFGNGTYYDAFAYEYENIIWSKRGTLCKPNLPLCSLYAQQYIIPDIISESAEFYTLGSYIAYYLTGNNTTNITDCAASGFYNVDYCERIAEEFPNIKLPKAVNRVQVIGKWNGIPVYSPVGDHQVSFLGCNVDYNQYLLNISTATQISTLSNEISERYECRPYFYNQKLCTVSNLIGGRTIREVCKDEGYDEKLRDMLLDNYSSALILLPKKEKILVSGGASQRFPDLINDVCEKMAVLYEIQHEISAMNGLKTLANEVHTHES